MAPVLKMPGLHLMHSEAFSRLVYLNDIEYLLTAKSLLLDTQMVVKARGIWHLVFLTEC